jgi:hypothetical protein
MEFFFELCHQFRKCHKKEEVENLIKIGSLNIASYFLTTYPKKLKSKDVDQFLDAILLILSIKDGDTIKKQINKKEYFDHTIKQVIKTVKSEESRQKCQKIMSILVQSKEENGKYNNNDNDDIELSIFSN